MKSSRPSSAQWMSSKTSTRGLRSASASKNVRQAVNDSSRLEAPASSSVLRPAGASGLLPSQARRRRPRARRARVSRRDDFGGVVLEDAGLGFHHLGDRPVADLCPYGSERPCLQYTSSSPLPIVSNSSQTSRLLPMPGTPTSVTSCGSRLCRARASDSTSEFRPAVRPTSAAPPCWRTCRRRSASAPAAPPRPGPARSFLGDDGVRSAVVDHVVRRALRLLDEDPVHGCRRPYSRSAVDDVPGDHPLAYLRPSFQRDECLARVDRDPDLEVAFLLRPVADRERGAHRAFGIVRVRSAPKTATTASMNFSTVPPHCSSRPRRRSW